MDNGKSYNDWSAEHYARWNEAQEVFGHHVLQSLEYMLKVKAKDYTASVPSAPSDQLQALARRAALDGVYAVMMLLDGVAAGLIDESHAVEYVLSARILALKGDVKEVEVGLTEPGNSVTLRSFRPSKTECVETIELAPDGDGLCGAFHGWIAGNETV